MNDSPPLPPPSYPKEEIVTYQSAPPQLSRPAYLVPVALTETGTEIMRVTDQSAQGYVSRVYRHAYSRRQPWNADESLLLLDMTPYPRTILNGKTYAMMGRHWTPGEAVWSNLDPDLMFGVSNNSFVKYKPSTRQQTAIRTFTEYTKIYIGGGEGNISNDDRFAALIGQTATGTDVLVYDILNNVIVSRRSFAGYTGPYADIDHAAISQDGKYVVIGFTKPTNAYYSYNASDMSQQAQLTAGILSHADMCVDSNGNQTMVTFSVARTIVSIDLKTAVAKQVLPSQNLTWSGHISCRNLKRPGWAYFSSNPHSTYPGAYLKEQVYSIKLDGSGTVQRFSPVFRSVSPQDLAYEREPHAVPNRNGTIVLFATDWGDASSSAVIHTYVTGVKVK